MSRSIQAEIDRTLAKLGQSRETATIRIERTTTTAIVISPATAKTVTEEPGHAEDEWATATPLESKKGKGKSNA